MHDRDTRQGPRFSIVVVTYQRARYLAELIDSVNALRGDVPHELIVLDNGSAPDAFERVQELVAGANCPTILIRKEENLLSPVRWAEAITHASGRFLLFPGDDDVLLPDYLVVMERLHRTAPDAVILSAGCRHIDEQGRRLGSRVLPVPFIDQQAAIADVLVGPPYPMPSSGLRRSAIDLADAPATRTAFDWWLWFQALLAGPAASTSEEIVYYRQHPGQEAANYTQALNGVDAARMLIAEVHGRDFAGLLRSWSGAEVRAFADRLISGPGPIYGDRRWGALVQFLVADVLLAQGHVDAATRLHAQAGGQAGILVPLGHLQTYIGSTKISELPAETWARNPVRAVWQGGCPHLDAWRAYLGIPDGMGVGPKLEFSCRCQAEDAPSPSVKVRSRPDAPSVRIDLSWPVREPSALLLLGQLGEAPGESGDNLGADVEKELIRRFRTFRRSRLGSYAEAGYHAFRRRS